jgi:hypothetical protein
LSSEKAIRQSVPGSARAPTGGVAAELDAAPRLRDGTLTGRPDKATHGERVSLREPHVAADRRIDHPLSSAAEREVAAALSRLRRLDSTRVPSGAGSTPEERIVRISIGRIDVRAGPVPPPLSELSRRGRETGPTPSLADYLAGKGRGTV